uniref:Retrotransposon gag protein n=1 Tax=Solanum tuberosum TaxID=4113 RepID=M1DIR0_SOLTU
MFMVSDPTDGRPGRFGSSAFKSRVDRIQLQCAYPRNTNARNTNAVLPITDPEGQEGNNSKAQSTDPTTPAGRPTQQGASSGIGGGQRQHKLYALKARQDQEDSPDVVTGVNPKTLVESLSVSTLVGEPVTVRRVYKNCPVTVSQKVTSADLVELEMIDFDIILGMDWLHSCYASVDCRTRIVWFYYPTQCL